MRNTVVPFNSFTKHWYRTFVVFDRDTYFNLIHGKFLDKYSDENTQIKSSSSQWGGYRPEAHSLFPSCSRKQVLAPHLC